jgi:hypothetical protein
MTSIMGGSKLKPLLLLLLIIFLLLGCSSTQEQVTEKNSINKSLPPKITLIVDGKNVTSIRGGYSWSIDGKTEIADSPTPPELVKELEAVVVSSESKLRIGFDNKPSSIDLTIWGNDVKTGKPLNQDLQDNVVSLPLNKGTYIYNIKATWKEGYANYAFKVEVQRHVNELESKLEDAQRKITLYEQIIKTPKNLMLNASETSSTGSDSLITTKVLLDHFRLLWKKQENITEKNLPSGLKDWWSQEQMQTTDYQKFGYIIRLKWDQPYTIDLLVDEKKWLESERGFLQASVPITFTDLIFYVPKGETVPQLYYRNGTGLYSHYSLNVDLLKPPLATQRYDWNVWVKDILEYDNKGNICHGKCMDMSELRAG